MEPEYRQCDACVRMGYGYTYRLHVCNACIALFRRFHRAGVSIETCETGGNCPLDTRCRYCRYQRCLRVVHQIAMSLRDVRDYNFASFIDRF
ncbi:hypothetical protein GCK72_020748 [Caenorhabditis remanei]|uniref:Nuclear receptor domain-containing protein n=1 Tax=Caenorhabditis remanei TaxID=31234 RepID=A0A6A5GG49_CAERE|nr:hypothetical protein GCK72_020748 [Caenorhabditis remanei]KAF1754188.1 hypothetical protein GCK72_020748 [Caenorhabditis remanei]